MLLKIIFGDFLFLLLSLTLIATAPTDERFPAYCAECEQEIWEEVPCAEVPSSTETPYTIPTVAYTSSTTTSSSSISSILITTTTPMPPAIIPAEPATTPSSYVATVSTELPIASPKSCVDLVPNNSFKKCYCECKLGCREFCRKVVTAEPKQQITQLSSTADSQIPGAHVEYTHLHQRKVYPKVNPNAPMLPYALERSLAADVYLPPPIAPMQVPAPAPVPAPALAPAPASSSVLTVSEALPIHQSAPEVSVTPAPQIAELVPEQAAVLPLAPVLSPTALPLTVATPPTPSSYTLDEISSLFSSDYNTKKNYPNQKSVFYAPYGLTPVYGELKLNQQTSTISEAKASALAAAQSGQNSSIPGKSGNFVAKDNVTIAPPHQTEFSTAYPAYAQANTAKPLASSIDLAIDSYLREYVYGGPGQIVDTYSSY